MQSSTGLGFSRVDIVLESAPYTTECIRCRSSVESAVTEVLGEDARWWNLEGTCPECGNIWEESGYELPPPGFREAILASNGSTVIRVEADSVSTAAVMRVLRLVESFSLAEARAKADELRATGLQGTRVPG
ncbi:hypothetical protein GCM10010198_72930 [Nocardia seriolae]|nr:hypothetical protein NSER024013_26850 [Nocardia seriolae]